jgi:hypothetical protein
LKLKTLVRVSLIIIVLAFTGTLFTNCSESLPREATSASASPADTPSSPTNADWQQPVNPLVAVLSSAEIFENQTAAIAVTGGTPPYALSVVSGTANVTPTGQISGPYSVGLIRFRIADSAAPAQSHEVILNVRAIALPPPPPAPVYPTFVGVSSAQSFYSAGSLTISKPVGTQAGDLMIFAMMNYAGSLVTPPPGWSHISTFFSPGYAYYTNVFAKTAGSDEAAVFTFNVTAVNGYRAMMVAYRNASVLGISRVTESPATNFGIDSILGTRAGDVSVTIAFDRSMGGLSVSGGGNQRFLSTTDAYWSGLVHDATVSSNATGVRNVSRASTIYNACGVQLVLRGS